MSFNFYKQMKTLLLILVAMFLSSGLYAQLSGIKTIDPAGSGVNNYTSFASAVLDLNANGVGAGGVTFNVASGATFNETVDMVINTTTSDATKPIVFQKSGVGANPIIRAKTGTLAVTTYGNNGDFVIKLVGTDYVTFNGLEFRSNSTATTNTTLTEYGIMLTKSATDACKNIKVTNCTFSLTKTNGYSIGIYQSNLNSSGTSVTVTSQGGRAENNIYSNNTFDDTYGGIYLNGYSHTVLPYDLLDNNNRITGNTITNFGGGSVVCYGIYNINQDSITVRENTVTGGSGNTTTLYAIYNTGGTNTNLTYSKNTVSLNSIGTSTYYGIYVAGSSAAAVPTSTVYVDSNTLQNCVFTSTSTLYGIYPAVAAKTLYVRNNLVTGNSTNSTVYSIYVGASSTVTDLICHSNTVENHSRTLTSMTGTFYGMYMTAYRTGNIYNNKIKNVFNKAGNTGSMYGYYDFASFVSANIYNNTVDSIFSRGTATIYGAYFSNTTGSNKNIYDNKISRLYSQGGATMYGMYSSSGDTVNIYRNSISNLGLDSARAITMVGMYLASGTGYNAYSNTISELKTLNSWTSSNSAIRGAYISTTDCKFYNNTIAFAASSTTTNVAGFATAAIEATTTPTNLDLRNNIFVNKSTNVLPGKTVGLRLQSTSLTSINSLQNNNIYFTTAFPTSASPIFFDGTNVDTTIEMLKARLAPAESNSITEDVPFVNSTISPFDLHINPSLQTRVEGGASVIATVTTDIDGATRSTTTPDIGSDEGVFTPVPGDFFGPSITNVTITPNTQNQCTALPHVITATITDASGVASSRVLWKKDGVTQTPINMTRGSSNVWSGTIPAMYSTTSSVSVSWNVSASDSATPANSTSYLGSTYKDASLYINAGYTGADTINAGATVQLNAKATPTLVVTGTNNTGNNTIYTPFYRGWGGIKRQFLYRGSELAAAGLPVGGITSLGFDVLTAAGAFTAMPGFTIYIDSTTTTTATTTFLTSNNAVFGPVSYTATTGLNNFSLTNPFVWNGTSNIIVTICWSDGTGGGGLTYYVKNSTTAYAASTYSNQDSQTPATLCGTTTGTTANGRPDILFGYNPPRTYTWTSTPSGILSSTSTLSTSAPLATAGNYQFIVSVNDGSCTNSDTVKIVAVIPQKPVANFIASATSANIGGTPTTVTFTDQSTNVPDSYKWTFTPSTVTYVGGTNSTSINPQVQFTGKGPYDVKLKVTNLGGSDSLTKPAYINTVTVYCPAAATSTADEDIGNVTISDIATGAILISQGIDSPFLSRVDNNKFYTNWYDSTSVPAVDLYKGSKYRLQVGTTYTTTNNYNHHKTAFIDYNDNGNFEDPGEIIELGQATSPITALNFRMATIFTVPCTADTGVHRMRVIVNETTTSSPLSSCGTFSWGEVEDFKVRVFPTQLLLDSMTTVQDDLTDVQPNTTNNIISVIKVIANGCDGTLPATAFNISTTGTTNLADISAAKLWYTGSSNVFATTQQYGTTATAAATLNFTGNTSLLADTNYFWLTYDLASNATLSNFIDATVNTVTIASVATVPSTTSPLGSRKINFPATVVNNSLVQSTAAVSRNTTHAQLLQGVIKMSSIGAAVNLTAVKVALTGTTRQADIKDVTVWFSGSNKALNTSTATKIDTTRKVLTDTMTFVGTASVGIDTNYVWLTYSIKDTAKIGNFVDGEILSYTINNNLIVPANTNPAGSRKIIGEYCIPNVSNTNDEDIGKFMLGSFSNGVDTPISSNPLSTHQYSNFLDLQGLSIQKAIATPVSVSIINSSAFLYGTSINVFIDLNQNGTFEVPAERVFKAISANVLTARTVSGTIQLPINTLTGLTRLRVTANETSIADLDPCAGFTWGEVEDYTINILPPPPGDYYPPDFAAKTITPAGGACAPTSHVVTVVVTDTTGVDTVLLNYSIGNVVQTPIVMTHVGNVYSGTIPAAGTNSVDYSFSAVDVAVNKNKSSLVGGTYKDGQLQSKLNAGADGFIGAGQSFQLNAFISNARQVGTATLASTGTPNPYYTTFWGNREQFLFTSADLLAAGLTAGPITSLGLAVTTVSTTLPLTNFTISIGSSALTDITTSFVTGLTPVFMSPSYTVVPNAINSHTFQTPYVWDGVSNIIIETCFNNSNWNGSQNITYSNTSYTSSLYYYADAATVCSNGSGTAVTRRPNFLLGQPVTVNYVWTQSANGGLSSTTIANPVATPTAGVGVYQYIVNVSDSTCTATDTVLVNVIPPPTVNLGPNQQLCSGSTLVLDAGNAGSTFSWSSGEVTQTINVTVGATYIVSVTNQAGLIGRDTILITQVAAPSVNLGVDTVTLCTGATQLFDAGNAGSTYLWSNGATTQTVNLTTPGLYSVAVTNTNGCTVIDSVRILNNASPVVALGADLDVCAGTTVMLDAGNVGSTYLWSTGTTGQTMTTTTPGMYYVKVTNTTGCFTYDTVVVTNKAKPVVALGADLSKCPTDSVTLDAGAGFTTYLWSNNATTQTIKVGAPGQYIATVTNADGCTGIDTVIVTNFALPVVNLGLDANICTSDTLTLDAGNHTSYLWSTGATTRTIKVSLAGTYSVTVVSAQGCSNSDAIVVTNKAIPDATWVIDTASGQSVTFKSTAVVGLTFAWNFGDPTSAANTSQLNDPLHVFTAPGIYTVTLTVTNVATGCRATTTQDVTVTGFGNDFAEVFKLNAAPNPFAGQTKIKYVLPENANNVSIEVYDMIGRNVATILTGEAQSTGTYVYDFKNEDLQTSSGVYMVKLIVDGKIAFTRIIDVAKK